MLLFKHLLVLLIHGTIKVFCGIVKYMMTCEKGHLGPVVQSVVSLTSSLRIISLTVLADLLYSILIFLLKKYSYFFSKTFQHIYVSLDVIFYESLTNDVVSFEQLGPELIILSFLFLLSCHILYCKSRACRFTNSKQNLHIPLIDSFDILLCSKVIN